MSLIDHTLRIAEEDTSYEEMEREPYEAPAKAEEPAPVVESKTVEVAPVETPKENPVEAPPARNAIVETDDEVLE